MSEDEQTNDAGEDDNQDGVKTREIDKAERGDTDGDGDDALASQVTKVLAVHQQQGRRCDKPHDNRTQAHKGALDKGALTMPLDVVGSNKGEDKRGQHHSDCGHQ